MTLLQDLRHGLRALLKSPLFTLTALFSLAIGLGATITVFTFINAFFLRPLPGIAQPEELVNLHQTTLEGERSRRFSKPTYDDLREWQGAFSGLAAFTDRGFNLNAGDRTELVVGQVVSGNYFEVLGVEAAAGRLLVSEDDAPGAPPAVVLSHRLWRQRFGTDQQVVGSTVRLNGQPFTVVGVSGKGFIGTFIGFASELFVPLAMAEVAVPGIDPDDRDADFVEVTGRLADGVTIEQARSGLEVVAGQLGREYFRDQTDYGIEATAVTGFDESIRGAIAGLVSVLLAIALLVLAVAGVNVANMLLVRSISRGREIAVRLALGAPRGRLVGHLLVECLLLALGGGSLGLLVAVWAVDALRAFDPTLMTAVSLALDFRLDPRVLLFALLLSLATGLFFGLIPALQASRRDLVPALRATAAPGARRTRMRSVLVVGQIALTLLLLVGAGLLFRVLERSAANDPGFEPSGVLTAVVDSSLLGFEDPVDPADFYRRLQSSFEGLDAFESVSLARSMPLTFGRSRTGIAVDGHEPAAGEEDFQIDYTAVAPGYFETLEIPLLSGRDFDHRDSPQAARVAVVNETLARRFWADEDALGQQFEREGEIVTVIGLARDSKYNTMNEEPIPYLYLPFDQAPTPRVSLIARTPASPGAAAAVMRERLRGFDQDLPVLALMPLERLLGFSLLPQRIAGNVAGILGAIALLLSAFGVYGVVAYAVSQRRHDLGIRVCLGARRRDIVGLVIGHGLRLIGLGVAVGLAASLMTTRFLESFLVGVSPTDPLTFLAILALLAGVTLLASYFPARRAAKTDPMISLRAE